MLLDVYVFLVNIQLYPTIDQRFDNLNTKHCKDHSLHPNTKSISFRNKRLDLPVVTAKSIAL